MRLLFLAGLLYSSTIFATTIVDVYQIPDIQHDENSADPDPQSLSYFGVNLGAPVNVGSGKLLILAKYQKVELELTPVYQDLESNDALTLGFLYYFGDLYQDHQIGVSYSRMGSGRFDREQGHEFFAIAKSDQSPLAKYFSSAKGIWYYLRLRQFSSKVHALPVVHQLFQWRDSQLVVQFPNKYRYDHTLQNRWHFYAKLEAMSNSVVPFKLGNSTGWVEEGFDTLLVSGISYALSDDFYLDFGGGLASTRARYYDSEGEKRFEFQSKPAPVINLSITKR